MLKHFLVNSLVVYELPKQTIVAPWVNRLHVAPAGSLAMSAESGVE